MSMVSIDEIFGQMSLEGAYEDAHDIIYIDPVTRQLHVPGTEIILGVEGDKRGERKYFSCPKVVGNGVQLTSCTLRVNFKNANGDEGSFAVTDIVYYDDCVVFSWELSEKVTALAGEVKFTICVCRDVNGETVNEWNTTLATGKVLEGMHTNGDTEEDHGGAGGVASGSFNYAFNTAAIGLEAEASGNALLDKTIDDVVPELSAPWDLLCCLERDSLQLTDTAISFTHIKLDNTVVLLSALMFDVRVNKDDIYVPDVTCLGGLRGILDVYLSPWVDSDVSMYTGTGIIQFDAWDYAIARIENFKKSELLGRVDTQSDAGVAKTVTFANRPLTAGRYVLCFALSNSTPGHIGDTIGANIASFNLRGMCATPNDLLNAFSISALANTTPFIPGDGTSSAVQRIEGVDKERSSNVTGVGAAGIGMYHDVSAYAGAALNYNNDVRGKYGIAVNHRNTVEAGADCAFVGGLKNIVNKSAQFIHGYGNIGKDAYQAILGKFAKPESAVFILGNGTSADDLSNAFVVYWDGSIRVGTMLLTESMVQDVQGIDEKLATFKNDINRLLSDYTSWAGEAATTSYDFRLTYGNTNDLAKSTKFNTLTSYNETTNPNWKVAYASNDVIVFDRWVEYEAKTVSDFVAFTLKMPSAPGKYNVELIYRGLYGVPSVDVYILPANTKDIAAALAYTLPVGTVELRKTDASGTKYYTDEVGLFLLPTTEVDTEKILVIKAHEPMTKDDSSRLGLYGCYFRGITLNGGVADGGITLKDRNTGTDYDIYVSNGDLLMDESEG